MPEIRYICLSDLHLGADNSLLTNLRSNSGVVDPTRPSAVLVELVSWLKSALKVLNPKTKPTLILNGDLLELALAVDNRAIMAFERFLELLFPTGGEALVSNDIIFLPGNHDHHLWENAREKQYVDFLQKRPPGAFLEPPWHTTKMVDPDFVDSVLLNGVIDRYPHLRSKVRVRTVYPNYAVLNSNNTKCLVLAHGHYVESIYMLMSRVGTLLFPDRQQPLYIWDIEGENFAWIDFFWSTLGRSGDVGDYIERLYDMLLIPELRRKLASQLAQILGREWSPDHPHLGALVGRLGHPLVSFLLDRSYGVEKTNTDAPLSADTARGLRWYLEAPLRRQLLLERNQTMPEEITFLFGHTHKPFTCQQDFAGFPNPTYIHNSGGWVVDTETVDPLHGGAIVLIDDGLNAVSVRMYNEADHVSKYRIFADAPNPSAFLDCVHKTVEQLMPECESFSKTVADSIDIYHANFKQHLSPRTGTGPCVAV